MDVLGVTLELDFFDADVLEVYERENEKVVKRIKDSSLYEGKSNAEAFRIQCRIVDDFFNAVFGTGTADRVFHGKSNLKDHMEAFAIVANGAFEARKEFDAMRARYAPNRAERRQEQKYGQVSNFRGYGNGHGKNGKGGK